MNSQEAGDVCDFCGARGVVVAWPVPSFVGAASGGPMLAVEQGTWAACAVCRVLVEAHDVDGLVDLAVGSYGKGQTAEHRALLRTTLRGMYDVIDRTRGNAVPVAAWPEWVK
jgi:hypothetical protein